MLAGGFLSGIFSDKIGRRPVLLLNLAINGTCGICAALSPSTYWLIFFRSLSGFGVGGTVTALFSLCVEHLPVDSRGFYVTILCSFWMIGSIFTAATAWIMLGNYVGGGRILDISWRWFAFVVALPSVACLYLVYHYIPESARFLVSKSKRKEAQDVLIYVHKLHHSERRPRLRGHSIDVENKEKVEETTTPAWIQRFVSLFSTNSQRQTTILLLIISFCQSFGSYGLATWITKLFKSVGLSNPFANAFLYAGANLPGNVFSAYVIDVIGRKRLLAGSMLAAAISTLFFAESTNGSATTIVVVACAFNACATSAWNAFGVISSESFPTKSRGSATSLINGVGRLGAITAQFINGFLVGPPPHVTALLLVTTAAMSTGAVCTLYLPYDSQGIQN